MRFLPKRRWLRFSIRTLLVAVTVLCVWLAWQASIVRERKALRKWAAEHGSFVVPMAVDTPLGGAVRLRKDPLPWHRRLLGDEAIARFYVPRVWQYEKEAQDLEEHYPEADIFLR